MDCNKIKKYLDEYIENDLDKNISGIIKKHLSSCEKCTSEFAFQKNYRKEIDSLEKMKAPADFLQQLNARIDKRSKLYKISRTLFFPLRIKLPIEAIGAAAGIVLILLFIIPQKKTENNIHFANDEIEYQKKTDSSGDIRIAEAGKASGRISRELIDQNKPHSPVIASGKLIVRDEITATYEIALLLNRNDSLAPEEDIAPRSAMPSKESAAADFKDNTIDKISGAGPDKDLALEQESVVSIPDETKKSEKAAESRTLSTNIAKAKAERKNYSTAQINSFYQIKNFAESNNGKIISQKFDNKGIQNVTVELPSGNKKGFLSRLNELGMIKKQSIKPEKADKSSKIKLNIQIIQQN
jgi:hypothetical protein